MDAGRGTYLDGKVYRDSSTGEESPWLVFKRNCLKQYPLKVFVGKENGCSKLLENLKNGWELSRR
jgi:hypothetical protein